VLIALFWMNVKPMTIIYGWYNGFVSLLEFGKQIALFIMTV
jgi:short-chain fatty acids transporter